MFLAVALIPIFQASGYFVVTALGLLVPGSVMGLLFYLATLIVYPRMRELTLPVVNFLLSHMLCFSFPPVSVSFSTLTYFPGNGLRLRLPFLDHRSSL